MQEFNTTQPNRLNRAYANVKALTDKLAQNIDIFIQGELQLPDEEMEFVMKCPFCHTDTLTITSNADSFTTGGPGKAVLKTAEQTVFTQPPPGIHATNPLNEETPHPKSQIKELHIDVKKRAPFTFITDSNSTIMSVINCNNCTKYVRDQKVSMYYGVYTTKHSTDCEKALAEAMLAIKKHENKVRKQQQQADNENERYQREREMEEDNMEEPQLPSPRRSDYSIGLGKLLSAVRASTNGDTIGDPLAAFALLGNNIFAMSHQTAPLPLTQAIGYLEKQNINPTFTRFGEVKATIHDNVFPIQPKPRHRRHELLDLHQNARVLQISSTKTK
ncbi:hypothetical protein DAPPUDRAFT_121259 [Daphnia pulex]|uniref:Uncharacterized protein n=1 Tax=Daphnia pulex TaxID=6669 RepID=E9I2Y6_DAPPU|nr:hypothetical protein DAPPUDRAFT_121259 [Daphnia pulex]|eukprot:EFX61644.1 hypothetical protein DAPPUDRAFT_121259 [Daphnia pulex]